MADARDALPPNIQDLIASIPPDDPRQQVIQSPQFQLVLKQAMDRGFNGDVWEKTIGQMLGVDLDKMNIGQHGELTKHRPGWQTALMAGATLAAPFAIAALPGAAGGGGAAGASTVAPGALAPTLPAGLTTGMAPLTTLGAVAPAAAIPAAAAPVAALAPGAAGPAALAPLAKPSVWKGIFEKVIASTPGLIGKYVSNKMANDATEKASQQQRDANERADKRARDIYEQQRADLAPWRNTGAQAMTTMGALMGLSSGAPQGADTSAAPPSNPGMGSGLHERQPGEPEIGVGGPPNPAGTLPPYEPPPALGQVGQSSYVPNQSDGGRGQGGGSVRMRTPDGRVVVVPPGRIREAQQQGGQVVA